MRILILGVGNPIMGDDGVGIRVARMLKDKLRRRPDVEIKELSVGGLKLVEEMLGYEEVYIVDSYSPPDAEPGRIRESTPDQFEDTLHPSSPHGTNFTVALQLYRDFEPDRIPKRIMIFTVDIDPEFTFRESMSAPVREAASTLTEQIARDIEQTLAPK